MERLSSWYSLHVVDMSAYTDSSLLRLNSKLSHVVSLRSNHRCTLMTGTPSSFCVSANMGSGFHWSGSSSFKASTGTADTYASARTSSPPAMTKWSTLPSSRSTIFCRRRLRYTSLRPPLRVRMCSTMGSHSRSLGAPSKNAILLPC
jgi:hypothetical protein